MASEYASSPEAQPADRMRQRARRRARRHALGQHHLGHGAKLIDVAEEVGLADGQLARQLAQLVGERCARVETLQVRAGGGDPGPLQRGVASPRPGTPSANPRSAGPAGARSRPGTDRSVSHRPRARSVSSGASRRGPVDRPRTPPRAPSARHPATPSAPDPARRWRAMAWPRRRPAAAAASRTTPGQRAHPLHRGDRQRDPTPIETR